MPELTPRETELAVLIASGANSRKIQSVLGITDGTESAHRCNLYRKAKVKSSVELCLWAIRKGLIVAPKVECDESARVDELMEAIDAMVGALNKKRDDLLKARSAVEAL